jgi:hypothetical protein
VITLAKYQNNDPFGYFYAMVETKKIYNKDSFTMGHPYWIKFADDESAIKCLPNLDKSGLFCAKRCNKMTDSGVYALFIGYSKGMTTADFITFQLINDNGDFQQGIYISIDIEMIVDSMNSMSAQVDIPITIIPLGKEDINDI